MKRNKRKKNNSLLQVEVLQNGGFLGEISKKLRRGNKVTLSAMPRSDLFIPFYPISQEITLFKVKGESVEVTADGSWQGFVTISGKPFELHSKEYFQSSELMSPGDYGCIHHNDLTVLFKIERSDQQLKKSDLDPKYRVKLFQTLFRDPREKQALLMGILCATIIVGGFALGLANRRLNQPTSFSQLSPEYTLPFIYHDHLRYLPEAIQVNLDRTKPIRSVLAYYNSFISMIMGYGSKAQDTLFSTSKRRFNGSHRNYAKERRRRLAARERIESEKTNTHDKAVLSLPVVVGESFQTSVLRLTDKITLLNESFKKALESRREFTAKFRSDPEYNFQDYKRPSYLNLNDEEEEPNYRVFEMETDEQRMYSEAAALAAQALTHFQRMQNHREPIELLNEETAAPVAIDDKAVNLTHVSHPTNLESSKMYRINAARFQIKKKKKAKEPLVGKINPKQISETIRKHQFDVRLCFELALRRNHGITGRMNWSWRLDSRGQISDLTLTETSINDQAMIDCVRRKILSWSFPKPRKGSILVQYPFSFMKEGG